MNSNVSRQVWVLHKNLTYVTSTADKYGVYKTNGKALLLFDMNSFFSFFIRHFVIYCIKLDVRFILLSKIYICCNEILEHVILCAVLLLQVPLVPIVPALSVFINLYLMLVLDVYTWIRFGVWLAIGKSVGFEFFIVVDLKSSILWYIVPCRPLKISQAKQKLS